MTVWLCRLYYDKIAHATHRRRQHKVTIIANNMHMKQKIAEETEDSWHIAFHLHLPLSVTCSNIQPSVISTVDAVSNTHIKDASSIVSQWLLRLCITGWNECMHCITKIPNTILTWGTATDNTVYSSSMSHPCPQALHCTVNENNTATATMSCTKLMWVNQHCTQ